MLDITTYEQWYGVQAMQGGGTGKSAEEEAVEDNDLDDLAVEEHKQRDSDTMQARSVLNCMLLISCLFSCFCCVASSFTRVHPLRASSTMQARMYMCCYSQISPHNQMNHR